LIGGDTIAITLAITLATALAISLQTYHNICSLQYYDEVKEKRNVTNKKHACSSGELQAFECWMGDA
jgi:hypothetical protein